MSDLTEFLLARVAEDEQAARTSAGVYPPPWEASDRGWVAYVKADAPHFREVTRLEQQHVPREDQPAWLGDAIDHIARWDPARVLAECEVKRRIVELHQSWPVLVEGPPKWEDPQRGLTDVTFRVTQQLAWATQEEYRKRFGTEPPTAPVLALLALPYANHEDYDESWRP